MRPLFRLGEPRVDETALAELLTFTWAAGSLSNVQGIERVPGGTLLTIPLQGGPIQRRRFCDVLDTLKPDAGITPEMAEASALTAIEASVREHLMSDVGYTLQLSGGVDSSLVAALASRAAGRRIASYAVSLGDHPLRRGRIPQARGRALRAQPSRDPRSAATSSPMRCRAPCSTWKGRCRMAAASR